MAEKNICKRQNAWTFFLSKLRLWIGSIETSMLYSTTKSERVALRGIRDMIFFTSGPTAYSPIYMQTLY